MKAFKFFFLFLSLPFILLADNMQLINDVITNGINVDLREPIFEDGVLSTDKGGVIKGADIRIQARNIRYLRKKSGEETLSSIEAEDDLIVEFGPYIFVGRRLEYDFSKKSGILFDGRSALEPWFFGGEKVYLKPDGSYAIEKAFVTTSESTDPEWGILADVADITDQHLLRAKNVSFMACRMPLLRLPFFRANLNTIFDQPIRYEARAGSQGPRVSVAYQIFSWNRFKTFARLDYRLTRGWGGGFENYYQSLDKREKFESINFIARDAKSNEGHDVTIRYRFQGIYHRDIPDKKITIDFSYDKLSDKEMATDYKERGLDIEVAGRTELIARKETNTWITNFLTKVKINNFQTLKQELPTLETNLIPFTIGKTGIISDNQFKMSYLDFRYANSVDANNYNSSRFYVANRLYRPFALKYFTLTPEIGSYLIFEGNSQKNKFEFHGNSCTLLKGNNPQKGGSRFTGLALFALEADTRLYKFYQNTKHVIRPFARYEYYTTPTTNPDKHYIFDIYDGLYRLNMLKFGVCQNFYYKDHDNLINRYLEADVWANAFVDIGTIPAFIPKAYSKVVFNSFYSLRHSCITGIDFEEKRLDHFNLLTEWTVSPNLAIGAEYRHRSAYSFRKADPYNYFIDAFRTVKRLRDSPMSDRRDTFLLHFFYQFHPNWSFEWESRHGWNRYCQPNYNEFEVEVRGTLWSAWNLSASYQHLEDDDRFVFAISLGLKAPNQLRYNSFVPRLQF